MECVSILLGVKKKELGWKTSKRLLGDMRFRENLLAYDKDNIPEAILKQVRKYTSRPDFTVDGVTRVSDAAGAIAAFCQQTASPDRVSCDRTWLLSSAHHHAEPLALATAHLLWSS